MPKQIWNPNPGIDRRSEKLSSIFQIGTTHHHTPKDIAQGEWDAATKHIKSTTKGQATAIIALTASVLEEERAAILSTGCDDFLHKPFREADIFATMNKHIGVRYIYEDQTPVQDEKSDLSFLLNSSSCQKLPGLWVANLKQAILQADWD